MPDVYVAPGKKKKDSRKRVGSDRAGEEIVSARMKERLEKSEMLREGRSFGHPFGTFMVRPRHVRFDTQEEKEEVLLLMRRHFLTNVNWILIWLVMLLAPLALTYFPLLAFLPTRFQFVSIVFWYLFSVGYVLEQFLSWYFNVYIITDERVIDIDFYSLIYKEVSAAKIENIEDVTFRVGGTVRSLFNFGTISIQTAGERVEFEFEDVPRPEIVAKFLNEMMLEEEEEKVAGRAR